MDLGRPHRPRVSRETRLLLTTALVAVTTLWGLARVRFPDRPPPPNPVAPILTQLAARPALDELAGELDDVSTRLEQMEQLLSPPANTGGYLGIEVQPLTPVLSRASGSEGGVVVTWVDPAGPAANLVSPGDVVEAANEQPLPTPLHWDARAARLPPGEQMVLRVRRSGAPLEIAIAAAPLPPRPPVETLGLTLAARPGTGSVVRRVAAGSAAELAGIEGGDVITRIAGVTAPGPAAVRRAFADAAAGEPVLVGFTRGGTHHVTALEK
jgi:S1-C subfamily serine protease